MKKILFMLLIIPLSIEASEEKKYRYYTEEKVNLGYYMEENSPQNSIIDYDDYIITSKYSLEKDNKAINQTKIDNHNYLEYQKIKYIKINNFITQYDYRFFINELNIFVNDVEVNYKILLFDNYYATKSDILIDSNYDHYAYFDTNGEIIIELDDYVNPIDIRIDFHLKENKFQYTSFVIKTYEEIDINNDLDDYNSLYHLYQAHSTKFSNTDLLQVNLRNSIFSNIAYNLYESSEEIKSDYYIYLNTNTSYLNEYKLYNHYQIIRSYHQGYLKNSPGSNYIKDETDYIIEEKQICNIVTPNNNEIKEDVIDENLDSSNLKEEKQDDTSDNPLSNDNLIDNQPSNEIKENVINENLESPNLKEEKQDGTSDNQLPNDNSDNNQTLDNLQEETNIDLQFPPILKEETKDVLAVLPSNKTIIHNMIPSQQEDIDTSSLDHNYQHLALEDTKDTTTKNKKTSLLPKLLFLITTSSIIFFIYKISRIFKLASFVKRHKKIN